MRLVLLGPPASGKGTQGDVLASRYEIPKISTGDMLRAARAAGTPLGREAATHMEAGKLVPDSVVIGLVEERIAEPDAARGYILDGFPRTVAQADSLDQKLQALSSPLTAVVQIDVPRELLIERAVLRRIDKRTGQIYHLKYSPPPAEAELVHRADDREETVLKRLDEYEAMTAALLPYYKQRSLLRRIDGVGSPEEVSRRITEALAD
jgi:adenylate kinase